MKIATLFFIALLSISSFGFAQTVAIGTQTWTTKNLNVATFRNGDAILEVKDDAEWLDAWVNEQPAWCYYNNDPKNGTKYGKLYNWYAVNDARGLAPVGYHIPTDDEWTVLSTFLGGEESAGKKMKNSSGWLDEDNGNNSSGFTGLPGGCRINAVGFFMVGGFGFWWSASEYDETGAWSRALCRALLYHFVSDLSRSSYGKDAGFSVRCVKDNTNPFGTGGTGSGDGSLDLGGPRDGKNRVRLNNPLLPLYKTEVDIDVHLKLIIDEDGKVVSAINLASKTTTTDQLIINGVISEVINQLKYNQEKNAGLQFTYLTCKIRAQ